MVGLKHSELFRKIEPGRTVKLAHRHSTEANRKNADVMKEYFAKLSKGSVRKMAAKYKLDLEMFGMDIEPYLSYAT